MKRQSMKVQTSRELFQGAQKMTLSPGMRRLEKLGLQSCIIIVKLTTTGQACGIAQRVFGTPTPCRWEAEKSLDYGENKWLFEVEQGNRC